jgi:hypothetical protein
MSKKSKTYLIALVAFYLPKEHNHGVGVDADKEI